MLGVLSGFDARVALVLAGIAVVFDLAAGAVTMLH